jgi:hypothetical protein
MLAATLLANQLVDAAAVIVPFAPSTSRLAYHVDLG